MKAKYRKPVYMSASNRLAGIRVFVTHVEIFNGRAGSTSYCPIALALERATGEHWYVGMSEMWRCDVPRDKHRRTPRRCQRFIHDFDRRKPVAPFFFYIPRRK